MICWSYQREWFLLGRMLVNFFANKWPQTVELVSIWQSLKIPEMFRLLETKHWKYVYIYIFSLKVREGFIKTCLFISSSYLASSQMHPPTIFSPAQNDHGSVFMYFHAGQQEIVRQPLVWLWFKMWAHLFWTHHLCITCRIWNFQLQSRPPWYPYPTTSTQVATCGKTSLLPRAGHLSEVRAF